MKQRFIIGTISVAGLLVVFLTQRYDWAATVGFESGNIGNFIFNRSVRFLLNDFLAIGLIYALFYDRKYVVFAIGVQMVGLIFILIPYFIVKLYYPGYNGPLINFIHRLVLNPLLILLLIPAFYYQKKVDSKTHGH